MVETYAKKSVHAVKKCELLAFKIYQWQFLSKVVKHATELNLFTSMRRLSAELDP